MEYFDTYNVQFLDLSDVEEEEKRWILTSLQIRDSSVKGPWNKPDLKHQNVPAHPIQNNAMHSPRPFEPYQVTSTMVINNNVGTVYPRPYQPPLPVYPPPFVAPVQYQPPLVAVNAPVVPVVNSMMPVNPPIASIVPVNGPIPYPQQVTYPSYTMHAPNPPVNIANSYPRHLPKQEHPPHFIDDNRNCAPVPPELGCPVQNNNVEPEDIDVLDDEDGGPVEYVNNVGSECESNEVLKTNGTERKSWASLFNKKGSVNDCGNGNDEANKPLAKVSPFLQSQTPPNEPTSTKQSHLAKFDDPNYYRMGEVLVKYGVDHRITSLQPRGLINHSNYCYINSILQAILACPPFYNLLNKLGENSDVKDNRKYTQTIDNMVKFVNEFHPLPPGQRVNRRMDTKNPKKEPVVTVNCDRPFEPFWIYKMLNGIRSDSFVVEGRQEDAEEFLGCLLNGLNDEMLELMKLVGESEKTEEIDDQTGDGDKEWQVIGPKNKGSVTRRTEIIRTPISDIFGGHIRSRLHRAGDQITDNIQPFFTLQLNIEKVNSVREALEALVCKNQLEGVTSSKTNEEVEAWQQVTIEELPVVLILHLKCFDFQLDGCTKIIKALEFPVDLKIDSKLLSSKTNYQAKEKQYKLFAVVYHDGKEATKGHYVTDAYHIGYASWIHYDDTSVRAVQEEQVLKPHGTRVPYLLFYRRCDTVRSK